MKLSTRIGWITFAALMAVDIPTSQPVRIVAQSAPPEGSCWRSLAPETGKQDTGLAFTEPSLAAVGSDEAWLTWQDDYLHIFKWLKGKFTAAPLLERDGVDGFWNLVVAASPSGRVVLAATANREDGSAVLHLARPGKDSWEWLGPPLISSPEPFRHVNKPSLAFLEGERFLVAWSEELNAQLAGLFVSRWDGSSWTRLGTLTPEAGDMFLTPAVAVDVNQRIWLAWSAYNGGVRVARWDGSAWLDVGRDSLEKLTAAQGTTALRELSLAVDSKGRAWVLRLAAKDAPGARLALARWDGSTWSAVPSPPGPEGKDSTVWSAAMIIRADAPTVAWSQADLSDNHYLFVSEWSGDGWKARLSGVHVVEGVSNVRDVRLAAGNGATFFVSWDETGKDDRRTRMLQAYPCAAGEKPAAPPKSTVERDTWPTTVEEAALRIVATLDDQSKVRVRATPKDQLIQFHHGWGMGIRNSLGLWRGNEKLLESCGRGKRVHPDACSMTIIEAVWALLQTAQ